MASVEFSVKFNVFDMPSRGMVAETIVSTTSVSDAGLLWSVDGTMVVILEIAFCILGSFSVMLILCPFSGQFSKVTALLFRAILANS